MRYGLNLRAGNIYGWVGLGDEVIWVQKLEGVGNASTLTSKEFPVFIGDIRLAKICMEEVKTRASSIRRFNIRGLERYNMDAKTKVVTISPMPMALDRNAKGMIRETYYT